MMELVLTMSRKYQPHDKSKDSAKSAPEEQPTEMNRRYGYRRYIEENLTMLNWGNRVKERVNS